MNPSAAIFRISNIVILAVWCISFSCVFGKDFYVTPHSEGKGDGTIGSPFSSLYEVQSAVRAFRSNFPNEKITVFLLPGVYRITNSLVFNELDGGTSQVPVVWRSLYQGTAKISGAFSVDTSLLKKVSDNDVRLRLDSKAQENVRELDLSLIGINNIEPFPDRFSAITGFLHLYYGGKLMNLSRWPNLEQGYAGFDRVIDSGSLRANQKHGATIMYIGNRPERWMKSLKEDGLWLRGFWRVPWVIEGLRVSSIDTAKRLMTFSTSTAGGVGSKYSKMVNGTRVGGNVEKWYALNLIEEIDQPGEWAVSFKRNKLYFWPPIQSGSQDLLIANKVFPLVVFNHASCINFQGIVIEQTLGDGIRIIDGQLITISGCNIKDTDLTGITIEGGINHKIISCEISNIGRYGIDFTGGKRATLTAGLHEITNNHIHHIGLAGPYAGIRAGEGTMAEVVGNYIMNNRIHDCPNSGIRYAGNNNVIEYNEIYRIGLDSSDLGAFYTNSGWTSQGNILRYNLVHHSHNAQGFYLDDGDCGDTITHNIVIGVSSGAFVGGGSDIRIDKNIFIDCDRAIHIDARGKSRGYTLKDRRLSTDLKSVPFKDTLWVEKYPHLSKIETRDTRHPSEVFILDNYAINCKVGVRKSAPESDLSGVHFGSLYVTQNDFPEISRRLIFNSKNLLASKIIQSAFDEIPFKKIGLHVDEYIKVLPERDWHLLDSGSDQGPLFDSQVDVNASNHN